MSFLQRMRTRRSSKRLGALLLAVGVVSVGWAAQAADDVNIKAGDETARIEQEDVRGIRGFIAEDSEQPSVRMQVTPEGLVSPGRDVTLVSIPENYGDVNEFHTTWCVDGIPFTHIEAGSEDRLVIKDGKRTLENDYGRIDVPEGGYAVCDPAFLNELGGFQDGDFTGGKVGDEDTKAIPAYPDLNESRPQYPPFDAENWSYFRRIPNVDTDNDGLDDEWEVRYFSGRIRPIQERGEDARDVPLSEKVYPVVREEILRLVRPQDDPDRDGWEWGFNYDEMDLISGIQLRPYEPTEEQPSPPPGYANNPANYDAIRAQDPYSFAWQLGIPYVSIPQDRVDAGTAGFGDATVVGMGEWDGETEVTGCTNLEEYTFGTDPLSADTDGDDTTDCRDIAGQDQNSLTFPVDKKVGESYDIDMHAFTLNSQWRTAQLDSFELPQQGFSGLSINRYMPLHARKYVRIDYQDKLQLSPSKGFEVKLDQEPDVVTTKTTGRLGQERIRMNAIAVLSDADESTLEYNWFLNGQFQEDSSGAGKRFFFFNVDDPLDNGDVIGACEEHAVTINLVDPATENSASEQLRVPVSPPIEFTKEVVGHVDRSRLGVDVQDYDASADSVDVNKGARTGDIVRFTANILGLAPTLEAAESGDASEQACAEKGIALDQLTYKWSFDGRVDREQTGRGNGNTQAEFEIQDEAATTAEDLDDSYERTTGSGHIVTLEVFGPNGELLTAADERISAVGPTVELGIRAETLEVNSKAAEEVLGLAEDIDYLVEQGDTVTVTAAQEFFAPGEDITFEVLHNDSDTPQGEVGDDGRSYTFEVGEPGDIEIVRFNAVSESGERAGAELQLRVVTAEELRSVLERRSIIGALSEFVPESLQNAFNIALGAGLLAAVFLIATLVSGSRSGASANIANKR